MAGRFIKLYDKLLKWEWYKNTNVKVLFLHLLLKANYKDLTFGGQTIRRGQLVTSLANLSVELGLSVKQIRGSLEHLISTGEVASQSNNRYRIITIVHYDEYQSDGKQNGNQTASEWAGEWQATGQAKGKQPGNKYRIIEQIENRTDRNIESPSESRVTARRFTPPSRDEIEIFCLENGLKIDVDYFLDHYAANGWMVGNSRMKDWKATVRNWARRDQKGEQRQAARPAKQVVAQQYSQRDYSDVKRDVEDDWVREMTEWKEKTGGAG